MSDQSALFGTVVVYSDSGKNLNNLKDGAGFGSIQQNSCNARAPYAAAFNLNTIATAENQTVVGKFNSVSREGLFVVGNGTDNNNRSNILVITGDRCTILGDLNIERDCTILGDLNVEGTIFTEDAQTVLVKERFIVTNSDGVELIKDGGLLIRTDESNTYGIIYDVDTNSVKLGTGLYTGEGDFLVDIDAGSIATREDSTKFENNDIVIWDNETKRLKSSNKSIEILDKGYGYHVGDVIFTFDPWDHPADRFGGTWVQISGYFLFGSDDKITYINSSTPPSVETGIYPSGSTGGEIKHTLTIDEIPSHTHNGVYVYDETHKITNNGLYVQSQGNSYYNILNITTEGSSHFLSGPATGNGQPHNNMPPYIACYIWRRTA